MVHLNGKSTNLLSLTTPEARDPTPTPRKKVHLLTAFVQCFVKYKVSRLRLYKMRVPNYYVKIKVAYYLRPARRGNNVNENKALSYCQALRYM